MVIDLSAQKKGGTLSKLNLSDRETIAICIVKKYPLAKIGEMPQYPPTKHNEIFKFCPKLK